MNLKIITVRESIGNTEPTRTVHYITKDRTMAGYDSPKSRGMRKKYEERNLDKDGQTNTIGGAIKRGKKKKKIVPRDRSKTSRVGVGTLEDKSKTKTESTSILKQPQRISKNEKTKKRGFFQRLKDKRKAYLDRINKQRGFSAGGLTGGADMKVIDKEKETHTKYNEKSSKDYGKPKKPTKKPVKKNAGGMIKAYSEGGVVKKKGIDGIAKRGKTRATRSR